MNFGSWGDTMCKENVYRYKNLEEDVVMNTMAIKGIDKSNLSGLTVDKKKILKSLQGIATSPIDFNKVREEQKYGKDRF